MVPSSSKQLFFHLFNSIHYIGQLQGHSTIGLQCLTFFLLPAHPSDSNSTLSTVAVASWASQQSQIEGHVGLLFSETPCPWHHFRQYSMSFGQGWKLLKQEGTSLGRPRVQPPSSPHNKGAAHWLITPKPPTFFHQKPLAEGSSKNAAAVKIATGRYFRPFGRVLG